MSIKLDLDSSKSANKTPVVHLLPCKIEYDGEANVERYFSTGLRPDTNKNRDLTGTFRGRPLNGTKLHVPEGYTGVVLTERHKPFSEDEEREFKIKAEFEEFTYWNLNEQCSDNDKINQALQWVNLSSSVHSPVPMKSSPKSDSSR